MGISFDNLSGQRLGHYELRDLLGRGGMAVVYRAYQTNLKRTVALKVLSPSLAASPHYAARFIREAETVAGLEHPHIIPIYDYGTESAVSYVAMRLLTGGTLSDRLRFREAEGQALPSIDEVAALLEKVGSALDYAHNAGVVHRDIKPSNIMFDQHGNPFLTDFGIAKLLDDSITQLTQQGGTLGTPTHMAPEQWRGDPVSAASDQYSMAVVVYTLLSGHLPFEAATTHGLMFKHLGEMPTPIHVQRAGLPEAVTRVLERALAKNEGDRFPTLTSFAISLRQASAGVTGERTQFFSYDLPAPAGLSRPITPTPFSTPAPSGAPARGISQEPTISEAPVFGQASTVPPTLPPTYAATPTVPAPYAAPRPRGLGWLLPLLVVLLLAGIAGITLMASGVLEGDSDDSKQAAAEETGTASPTVSLIPDSSDTPDPTETPSATPSITLTRSPRELAQMTLEAIGTLNAEFTAIAAEIQTQTATMVSATPTATFTVTPTPTDTPTETPIPSDTPVPTDTFTPSPTVNVREVAQQTIDAGATFFAQTATVRATLSSPTPRPTSTPRPRPTATRTSIPSPTVRPTACPPASNDRLISGDDPASVISSLYCNNHVNTPNGEVGGRFNSTTVDVSNEVNILSWTYFIGDYSDFVVRADIEWGAGPTSDYCGFILRYGDSGGDFYYVAIDRTGNIDFAEQVGGVWNDDARQYTAAGRIDRNSNATNELLVAVDGNTITVFVNRVYSTRIIDNSHRMGQVALMAGTYTSSPSAGCSFSDAWVWQLE